MIRIHLLDTHFIKIFKNADNQEREYISLDNMKWILGLRKDEEVEFLCNHFRIEEINTKYYEIDPQLKSFLISLMGIRLQEDNISYPFLGLSGDLIHKQ